MNSTEKLYTLICNVRHENDNIVNGLIERHYYEGWTKDMCEEFYGSIIGDIVTFSIVEEVE